MWPKLVASKLLSKTLATNNFVFPTTTNSSQESLSISSTLLHHQDTQNYKVFVSTWNVGGIVPPDDLDMEDLLDKQNNPCDIYVLGFQEVVPLNTANVLGKENSKICTKWNSLIRKTLNNKTAEFRCLTSKKMVGIFISVWVRCDIHPYIQNPSVSCVGCGIMGCLGNKGSVSIRFQLHETSFCFVCTHLASGDREGDERNRNANAADLFARTSFSIGRSLNLPTKILDHDRVIILGDLNYRISMPESETRQLVNKGEWDELVQNDQLRRELDGGHVFKGWHEGAITFAPTYKYFPNSDNYYCCVGKKAKRRNVLQHGAIGLSGLVKGKSNYYTLEVNPSYLITGPLNPFLSLKSRFRESLHSKMSFYQKN